MIEDRNLLDRTLKASESVIDLFRKLPKNDATRVLMRQLLRSGTSIGANYREACEAESGKDFVHKIRVAKKEARESSYWLKLISKSNPELKDEIIPLEKEVLELLKIFASISSKFNKGKKKG